MIFGDKNTFAIEATLEQSNDKLLFIDVCYWVKNIMIGDFDQRNLLSVFMPDFQDVINQKGLRKLNFEQALNTESVIKYLIENTWDTDHKTSILYKQLKPIDIHSHLGESFQGFFIFLVETDSYDWLLCNDSFLRKNIDIKIPKNQFYNTYQSFVDWIRDSTMLVLKSK
jgi:Immunity protein 42